MTDVKWREMNKATRRQVLERQADALLKRGKWTGASNEREQVRVLERNTTAVERFYANKSRGR